ncbi:sensor histidine kinase [Planctomonas deserti]|uniref:sensor histidine kinase n=1 Tax=Planctomonas deserti TaxID=2144185 RepID=UPI000D38D0DF|nr:sensor histidine kinase [Planctomonas deserti]
MPAPEFGADGAPWDRPWSHPDRHPRPALRLWVPVLLSLFIQVPASIFAGQGPRFLGHGPEVRADVGPALAFALIGPLALIGARRFPGPVVAVVAAAAVADLMLASSAPGPPYIALAFAIVGAIVRGARPWAWASVGVVWLGTLAAVLIRGSDIAPGRAAFTTFGVLAMVGIGEAVRARRERIAEYRRANLQRRQSAAEAERVRIARELHDVLAHSLSSINVQAGVGLHLMDRDPAQAAAALAEIKATSKTALDEVRSVLGVLRSDDGAGSPLAPEPDLSQLERLAASITARGVAVRLDVAPDVQPAEVPRPLQLALYRIVQESLTNVLRHADAAGAIVSIRRDGAFYVAEVLDDGRGTKGTKGSDGADDRTDTSAGGRGVLGMRERAELLGGTLEAGPRPGGGYRVLARIPAPRRESA